MAALFFILDTLVEIVVVVFLLRLAMPLARADFRNPLGHAVLRFTDPLVLPLRRLFGSAGRLDLASVVALLLVQAAGTLLTRFVAGLEVDPAVLLAATVRRLAQTVLRFYFWLVVIHVLLSWLAPGGHGPGPALVGRLCAPLLAPMQRWLPPLGGLDLSPLVVLIGLQALQILLR